MKKEYKYYVVYKYIDEMEVHGNGSSILSLDKKIENETDIRFIKQYLEEKNGYNNVLILNWILL